MKRGGTGSTTLQLGVRTSRYTFRLRTQECSRALNAGTPRADGATSARRDVASPTLRQPFNISPGTCLSSLCLSAPPATSTTGSAAATSASTSLRTSTALWRRHGTPPGPTLHMPRAVFRRFWTMDWVPSPRAMMDRPLRLRSPSGSREPCHTTTVGNSDFYSLIPKRPRCQWTRPTLPLRMAMRRAKTDGRHSSLALCLPLGASVNSRPGTSSRPNTWCRCFGPQLSCQAPHCGSPGTAIAGCLVGAAPGAHTACAVGWLQEGSCRASRCCTARAAPPLGS